MQKRLLLGAAALFGGSWGISAAHADSPPAAASKPIKLDRKSAQLKLVQVVFRHGARTPLTDDAYLWEGHEWNVCGPAYQAVPLQLLDVNGGPAPSNAHDQKQMSTILAGGASKGELTRVGQLQALELGYWLRQQYIDSLGFLPASYSPGLLSARTTNFSRTRATLAGVLTGLFPGQSEPIPVTTSGDLDEILYADTKRCPHLKVLMAASEAMLQSRWDSQERSGGIRVLQQQLDKMMNLPQGCWDKRWMFTNIHDALTSLAAHGKELPHGLTEEMKQQIDRLATEEISAFICPALVDSHGHTVLRLSMGRLLDTLLTNMDAALQQQQQQQQHSSGRGSASSSRSQQQQQQQQPKLMLFSGHDSTIMPLLTALGVELDLWPPYISNLVFELWELQPPVVTPRSNMAPSSSSSSAAQAAAAAAAVQGPFVVRVLYNKQALKLPGAPEDNPTLLEFSQFKHSVLAPFILSEQEHEQACAMAISHDGALPQPESDDDEWSLSSASSGSSSRSGGQPPVAPAEQQQQRAGESQPQHKL